MLDKNKNLSLATRFRMQYLNSKFSLHFLTGLLVFGFVIYYLRFSTSFLSLSPDRSETYNIKVLPADLDDSNLALLDPQLFSYLAVIDAGSSGCRAHVYRYGKLGSLTGPLYVLPEHKSQKVKPGLSTFAQNPSSAGASLEGLVSFLKQEVPQNLWKDTPVWLKATAGLRLVEKSAANSILNSVRDYLGNSKNSPFYFKPSYAQIIPGSEEGAFGWIAYNYLKKIIGPKKQGKVLPYAVVEMGGASTQVSQLAPNQAQADQIPANLKYSFDIEGTSFVLFTNSYLGYGAEQAREAVSRLLDRTGGIVSDPCLNLGYNRDGTTTPRKQTYEGADGAVKVMGAASGVSCQLEVAKLFAPPSQSAAGCTATKDKFASFKCTDVPAFVLQSPNFLVFENYFYTSSAIGVVSARGVESTPTDRYPLITTPAAFLDASKEICSKPWSEVEAKYPLDGQEKETNVKWCFSSSYATELLLRGLGLPEDKPITIQKYVDNSEIEWALGAAYKEVSDFLKRTHLRSP